MGMNGWRRKDRVLLENVEYAEKMKTGHSKNYKVDIVLPVMKPDHADHQHCGVRKHRDLSNLSK
jgi:hypothetical protein